jgi:hypothetical protein
MCSLNTFFSAFFAKAIIQFIKILKVFMKSLRFIETSCSAAWKARARLPRHQELGFAKALKKFGALTCGLTVGC